MSDLDIPPHPPPHGSVLVSISERLIRVLPPAFLLLVILNCAFLGVITWVFQHNSEARNAMLTKIVEKCLATDRQHSSEEGHVMVATTNEKVP